MHISPGLRSPDLIQSGGKLGPQMIVRIDSNSTVRPFEQIKNQLRAKAESGKLNANSKLPTVRALAETLGLAPNTVARSYRELEHEGIIVTRGRHGTFVTADARKVTDELERTRLLQEAAENLVTVAHQTGATKRTVTAALNQALEAKAI